MGVEEIDVGVSSPPVVPSSLPSFLTRWLKTVRGNVLGVLVPAAQLLAAETAGDGLSPPLEKSCFCCIRSCSLSRARARALLDIVVCRGFNTNTHTHTRVMRVKLLNA